MGIFKDFSYELDISIGVVYGHNNSMVTFFSRSHFKSMTFELQHAVKS